MKLKAIVGTSIVALLLSGVSGASSAKVERNKHRCDLIDLKTDEDLTGVPCIEEWDFERDTHVIIVGGRRIVVSELDDRRWGVWSFVKLNGRPAVRYEHDKYTYSYASEDLQFFLETTIRDEKR